MEHGTIAVVRGKQVVVLTGSALRAAAARAEHVVLDLGAGDGRWIYRLARRQPGWVCVAVDANASGMREASFRAGRKPNRGGAANAWFVRAVVETPPPPLWGLADEIHIHLPWGSLLSGVLAPHPEVLAGIARLGKAGAALAIRVNGSALDDPTMMARLGPRRRGHEMVEESLAGPYAAAGITLDHVGLDRQDPVTTWGRRLGGRHPARVLALDGTVTK